MTDMNKSKFTDSNLKNPYVKKAVVSCFVLAILFLLPMPFFIPSNNKDVLGFLVSSSLLCTGLAFFIMGVYVFLKNINTYRKYGTSFGLNMHGSVRYESGLGYYIFNQLMNLVLLGTGGYLIYLMGGVMWGILMH